MALEMFSLLDDSLIRLKENHELYEEVESKLVDFFYEIMSSNNEIFIGINSRIKAPLSLKEKMLRNEFYMNYHTVDDVFDNLRDLIGISVQCRFIQDEKIMMDMIKRMFGRISNGVYVANNDDKVFLLLNQPQPQLQRNGYPIYRIDGYYKINDKKINFELQIKSLIHNFWSDVEHQIVYKNNKLVLFDSFMSDIMSSIRDNLEIVDNQLQTVYSQIKKESIDRFNIGMDEQSFKIFLSRSINDLYTTKSLEQIEVSTDFRKCSSMIAQFIYIQHFIGARNSGSKMIEYFELFDKLKDKKIDFNNSIEITDKDLTDNFLIRISDFLKGVINSDFKWHVFFVMIFSLEESTSSGDFYNFVEVYANMILNKTYLKNKFPKFEGSEIDILYDKIMDIVATNLIKYGKIDIVYEENVYNYHRTCKELVDMISYQYDSYELVMENSKNYLETFRLKLIRLK